MVARGYEGDGILESVDHHGDNVHKANIRGKEPILDQDTLPDYSKLIKEHASI